MFLTSAGENEKRGKEKREDRKKKKREKEEERMAEEQVVGDLFASQNQKKKNLPREFQIRKAVLKGDLGLLKKEMEKGGVFLDWQDQNKATYAHHAALRGHLEVCVGWWLV